MSFTASLLKQNPPWSSTVFTKRALLQKTLRRRKNGIQKNKSAYRKIPYRKIYSARPDLTALFFWTFGKNTFYCQNYNRCIKPLQIGFFCKNQIEVWTALFPGLGKWRSGKEDCFRKELFSSKWICRKHFLSGKKSSEIQDYWKPFPRTQRDFVFFLKAGNGWRNPLPEKILCS